MNTKSNTFGIVLEKYDKINNFVLEVDHLRKFVKEADYIEYCAFILHDKDKDEFGEMIRPHYHFVIRTLNNYAKNTILNDIVKNLVKNRDAVSIRVLPNLNEAVCYLVHQGSKEKHQYSYDDIYSTDELKTQDILENPICDKLTIQDIFNTCLKCSSLTEVYFILGLKNSRTYHNIIKDVWEQTERRF